MALITNNFISLSFYFSSYMNRIHCTDLMDMSLKRKNGAGRKQNMNDTTCIVLYISRYRKRGSKIGFCLTFDITTSVCVLFCVLRRILIKLLFSNEHSLVKMTADDELHVFKRKKQ